MSDNRVDENLNINTGACIIKIIHSKSVITIYPEDEAVTLRDCYEKTVEAMRSVNDTITVLSESLLSGTVYRYGNHGAYWEQIGKLDGYA